MLTHVLDLVMHDATLAMYVVASPLALVFIMGVVATIRGAR